MPEKINLNTKEYNDDFEASKNFYKVLFRPGYSIQTRELTTLQSILQNQIEQFGKYQFKQGQQVIPGEVSFNNRLNYVKLSSVSEVAENVGGEIKFKKYDIKDLINLTLTGLNSGVQALVVEADYATETESDTIYVNYISGGDNSEKTFRQGEELEVNITNSPRLTVGTDSSSLPSKIKVTNPDTLAVKEEPSTAMGFASAVKVETGIYFVNGFFVQNEESLLVIDKYNFQPSKKIGFLISEEIVTPEKDITLYDNARGFSNYTAPGAHRLKIDLNLVAYDLNTTTDDNFIELLTLKLGVIQRKVVNQESSVIEETLARRTYDESGDYIVDNFPIEIREYLQKGDNQGIYPLRVDGTVGDDNFSEKEAETKIVAGLGAGKAYVRGYEIANKQTKFVTVDKARDVLTKENNRIKTYGLPSFNITNVYGTIPLNNEGEQLTSYPTLYFSSIFNDGYLGYNGNSGFRKTSSRRSLPLRSLAKTNVIHDYAIKTIYVKAKTPAASFDYILGQKLYYVANLGQTLAATTVDYVEVIAFSTVERPDDIGGEVYLELTVLGNKRDLQEKFLEFDNGDFIPSALSATSATTDVKRRQLFYRTPSSTTDNGAFNAQNYYWQASGTQIQVVSLAYEVRVVGGVNTYIAKVTTLTSHGLSAGNTITIAGAIPDVYNISGATVLAGPTDKYFEYTLAANPNSAATGNIILTVPITATNVILPFGEIVDYSETIIPIIGFAKSKNITLLKRAAGFNQETDKIISKGKDISGNSVYNAIFNLEYFNPLFFTKITTESKITSGFSAGQYITGSKSGAYAVIEGTADSSFSSSNTLHVKVLSGTFASGETITDESGNSISIARENTISHFVVTKRGSGYAQSTSVVASKPISINGKAVDVSIIKPQLVGGKAISVSIIDRNLFSDEYVSPPSVIINSDSGVNPTQTAVVKAVLFKNVITTYTNENVKSLYSEFGGGGVNKFTADVETFDTEYSVSKDITTLTFSGKKGQKYLICLAFSGDPAKDLVPGDIIQYIDVNNTVVRSLVESVSSPSGLSKAAIYLDTALKADVNNSVIVRKRTKLTSPPNPSLLFPIGFKSPKSLIQDSDNTKFKYYIRRDFITTSSTSGGKITFSAQLKFGTQRFIDFEESNFLLTILDKGNSNTGLENGDVMYLTKDQVAQTLTGGVAITLDNLTFRTDAAAASNVVLKLSATIEIDKASPKTKVAIRNKRIAVVSSGDKIIPFRGYDYDEKTADVISYADAFGIYGTDIKVFEGSTSSPPVLDDQNNIIDGFDITDHFTFDDGQRDTFYDVSRLVLKPGYSAPIGQLVIVFNYFEHSQGDFSIVDSYTLTGTPISDIPSFNSPVLGKVSLTDVVDFRPKVDVNTILSGFQNKTLLLSGESIGFNGSGGIPSAAVAHDASLEASIIFNSQQYLDRIDGIFLNKKGEFIAKKGNSSLNPSKPETPDDSIALYYLFLPAYTNSVADVRVTAVDNRRYTMRDIGKLEKRIERLEYYTTMSILEQQTFNMQVKDDIGLDRFKSGIIVDSFENHAVGNLPSLDYKCAIDTQQSILRPRSIENSYSLVELNTSAQQRATDGYVRTGDVITLPYTPQTVIQNKFATAGGEINPNPFVVVQYVGDLSISPNIDHWYDIKQSPSILNNDTKVFSVFLSKADSREGYSSLNNFYLTNWIGTNRTFFNVSSLSEVTSNSNTTILPATVSTSSNISPQNNEIGKGVQSVSNGSKIVSSSIQLYARSKAIKFIVRRLKPNTKYYAFIDTRNVTRWVAQDTRFTQIPGNSVGAFGSNGDNGHAITSNENGDASGILIFPAGYAPVQNASWTGDINTVSYDNEDGALKLNFAAGIKTIRFTTSTEDKIDNTVDSFAECKYYPTGIFPNQPASIISTIPSFFKAPEGIQFIDNASTQAKPSPLSQTFRIENFEGGVFVTELDLFFSKKSDTLPVRVYLTDTNSKKPGNYIIPGTEVVKLPDTYLKITANSTLNLTIGETISGSESGVKGVVKEVVDKNGNKLVPTLQKTVSLSNDQVYTLVLSNYISATGSAFKSGESLVIQTLIDINKQNNSQLLVSISKDSGKISKLLITDYGEGYDSATLIIQSPQLPGGSSALGNVSISNGEVFEANIILPGSGYTDPPSIILKPNGSISREAVIIPILEVDTPAVRMGVSVDPNDGVTTSSISPTKFVFDNPIYLQNNTDYALSIETDSTNYRIWSSKLGETDVATSQVITQQPLLGSVFKSQNVDTWTEDLSQDIKFTLYRAVFTKGSTATARLTNEDLGYEMLDMNSIETDASSNDSATSLLFKNNNKITRILHINNGFEDSGKSYVTFKQVNTVGGIDGEYFNTNLFPVSNSGLEYYNITTNLGAGSSTFGGGNKILASYNRKYEKLYPQIGYLSFTNTKFNAEVKTTNIIPLDSVGENYTSYQQSDYETTFLNEEHYFTNQKVIASYFNEIKNNATWGEKKKSLVYKLTFSTTLDHLSPIIDLRSSSVKTISSFVDKGYGDQTRYGRRYKILKFYPVYKFEVSNLPAGQGGQAILPTINQSVVGVNTKTKGDIIKVTSNTIYVKIKNTGLYQAGEALTFGAQNLAGASVSPNGITEVLPVFTPGTNVEVYREDLVNRFSTKIYAKIISWDKIKKELVVLEEKAPINGNYTAYAEGNTYGRSSANNGANQQPDIIRVYDKLWHQNIAPQSLTDTNESVPGFIEVSSATYSPGILYISDINSKNSSSVAKYVTKEITLANPATTIDVRLTANLAKQDDIEVYYKIKPVNSQSTFDDVEYIPFNGTGYPDFDVAPSNEIAIAGLFENQSSYKEHKYTAVNLNEFSSFAIKIVMKASNPCYVPKIQDARIVAAF